MPFADPAQKRAYDAARYAANRDAVRARVKSYRAANGEKIAAYNVEYRARNRDALCAKDRSYYQANKKERLARNAIWAATHSDKALAIKRAWKRRNPQDKRDYKHRRKARLRGAGAVDVFAKREIYERDGWLCGICGEHVAEADASVDHIVPVSKGGAHTRDNVRTSHIACNRKRGNRT